MPKNDQIWPKIGIFAILAGSFGALLVGWLVVVARGLDLAIHLFTLYNYLIKVSLLCEYGVGGSGDETISCKLEAAGHQADTAHPKIHWISTDFDQKFVKSLSHLNIGWVSQILNKF